MSCHSSFQSSSYKSSSRISACSTKGSVCMMVNVTCFLDPAIASKAKAFVLEGLHLFTKTRHLNVYEPPDAWYNKGKEMMCMKGFQMKVSIRNSKPCVWRRLTIPTDATFYQLHQVLQESFGWMDYHMHCFTIPSKGIRISDIDDEDFRSDADENTFLFEYINTGTRLIYTYDYGDDWKHEIVVEKELELAENYPLILKWKGDNFAEDAGNVQGFYDMIKRAADQMDPEHQELSDWLKLQHIPFDLAQVNEKIKGYQVEKDTAAMSAEVSEALNLAIVTIRDQLWEKVIHELSLIILKDGDQTYYIGFNQVQDDITLQIYDDESEYLQGVDYVSSHSQGNLFAHAICIILSEQPIPIRCWKTNDLKGMAKRMKPGFFPKDLDEADAMTTIQVLQSFSAVASHWTQKQFPSYGSNECLYADKAQDWRPEVMPIRLHRTQDTLHLSAQKLQKLQEQAAKGDAEIRMDLISIPGEQMSMGMMDVILVIEGEEIDYEDTLHREHLASFQAMNMVILHNLYEFVLQNGIPQRIIINNENMRTMICGFCDDVGISLVIEPFMTQLEEEFVGIFDDTDMQVLDTLADMTPEEFYEFMSKMDDNEMQDFHKFLEQYMNLEEYQELFPQDEEACSSDKKGKTYDA